MLPASRRRLLLIALLLPGTLIAARVDELSVDLEAARAALESGRSVVIDIREPGEHVAGVAAAARLLPLSQLRELGGYGNVRFVEGGMSEWMRRGWPLVKPGG